jgi:hypothetical protein
VVLGALAAAWAVTRLVLITVSRARGTYPFQDDPFDVTGFAVWGAAFAGGEGPVPLRDGPWEYPAGAAIVVVLPALLKEGSYALGFIGQMLLWDLAALLLLAAWGRRAGSFAGAWFWVAAVPLLGPVAVARYDVVPTVFAIGGLIASAASAPLTAGIVLASGGVLKLWPAALLPLVLVLPTGDAARWAGRVVFGGALIGAVVLAAVAGYGGLPQLLSFLSYQRDRGLEVESLPALPLMLSRAYGGEGIGVTFAFGSYQVEGPGDAAWQAVGSVGLLAVALGVAALAWRARRRGADRGPALAVLAVVLMSGVLVFDKVLSAQYPLWLAGVLAVALCWRGSDLLPAVVPMVGLLLLTQYVYPLAIQDLLAGQRAPVLALAARDLLLLVVLAVAVRAAWRLQPAPASGGPEPAGVGEGQRREQREGEGEVRPVHP